MNTKLLHQVTDYIEYFGNVEEVTKQLHHCHLCGAKLLLSHMPDYKNYFIQETSRCLDCGEGTKQSLHTIN